MGRNFKHHGRNALHCDFDNWKGKGEFDTCERLRVHVFLSRVFSSLFFFMNDMLKHHNILSSRRP
jgi:hypothetical protein